MKFDALKFYRENHVPTAPSTHKHHRPGWIQVACPFCKGNEGYHLGFNLSGNYHNCWRCGWHPIIEVVKTLGGLSWTEAKRATADYRGRPGNAVAPKIEVRARRSVAEFPMGTAPMGPKHRSYLEGRGFDPDKLERIWDLKGTGPVGGYKFRIIAPIYYRGRMISYQGRDITGKSPLKYKACPQELEAIDHKNVLYGLDMVDGDSVVVVEGVFDAWKLGPGAVATFGIKYTPSQILELAQFKNVFMIFDSETEESREDEAAARSEELAASLSSLNPKTQVEVIELDEGDPGDLPQEEANNIMKELVG